MNSSPQTLWMDLKCGHMWPPRSTALWWAADVSRVFLYVSKGTPKGALWESTFFSLMRKMTKQSEREPSYSCTFSGQSKALSGLSSNLWQQLTADTVLLGSGKLLSVNLCIISVIPELWFGNPAVHVMNHWARVVLDYLELHIVMGTSACTRQVLVDGAKHGSSM